MRVPDAEGDRSVCRVRRWLLVRWLLADAAGVTGGDELKRR
jgi:hypothetical protein